jgi:hypothetical protein
MKIIIKPLFLYAILFFLLSCPATKSAWYDFFSGSAHRKIQIFEKKPPKDYGKYKTLGEIKLNNFAIEGRVINNKYYCQKEMKGKPTLTPSIIQELQAEAYEKWKEKVSALINTSCNYTMIKENVSICECHRKGFFPNEHLVHSYDSPKKIKEKCKCEGGKVYWKRNLKSCTLGVNCTATAISK